MIQAWLAATFIAALSLSSTASPVVHGGTYAGPGDTVPPGNGGGGGGGHSPGATPGSPSTPAGPSVPGAVGTLPSTPGTPGAPGTRATTGAEGADLGLWQYWWRFNREPYLRVKEHVFAELDTDVETFFTPRTEPVRDRLRPSEETIRHKIVPALLDALEREKSQHIVTGCLIALARIGDSQRESGESPLSNAIRARLLDPNVEIAETAAVSLGILANDSGGLVELLGELAAGDVDALRERAHLDFGSRVETRVRAFAAYGLGLVGYRSSDSARRVEIVRCLARELGRSRRAPTNDVAVACVVSMGLVPLSIANLDLGVAKPTQPAERADQIALLLEILSDETWDDVARAQIPTALARLAAGVDEGAQLRAAVSNALIQPLGAHAKSTDGARRSAAIALGQLGTAGDGELDRAIRAALIAALDREQQTAAFAMISLAKIGARASKSSSVPLSSTAAIRKELSTRLTSRSTQLRTWAALALGVLEHGLRESGAEASSESAAKLAAEFVDARNPHEIGAFAIALGLAHASDANLALRDKLMHVQGDDARGSCAIALGLLGDVASVDAIAAAVRTSKYQPALLDSAATALGILGDKRLVPELVAMLADAQSTASQAAIASALGRIGDARSIDPLIAFLRDQEHRDEPRGFAAAALGIVADKEPLPWNTKISVDLNYRATNATLYSPASGTGILDIL